MSVKKNNIALDGPSGSGKSTVAKILSKRLNILYLDTGAMYRAVALEAEKLGIDSLDEKGVSGFIDKIDLQIKYIAGAQRTMLDGGDVSEDIRKPYVSMLASNISSLKCVRLKMVEMQRKVASENDCVLDGRDIGSFVLPDAKYKFYITADSGVRAKRRYDELTEKGNIVDFDELHAEIIRRDENDSKREFAPLIKADDAILIDTSEITAEQVADIIEKRILSEK